MSVTEAAVELGISAEAVRSRLKRGTLRSLKEDGKVYVLLEADRARQGDDQSPSERSRSGDQSALVENLREQVAYLQGVVAARDRELQARTEEIRRRDQALEREQQLAAMFADRLRELEAPKRPQRGTKMGHKRTQRIPKGQRPGPLREAPRRPHRVPRGCPSREAGASEHGSFAGGSSASSEHYYDLM